jgi:hypothetical protein
MLATIGQGKKRDNGEHGKGEQTEAGKAAF